MRLALANRSVSSALLAVCLFLGLLTAFAPAEATQRTVIGELFTRDG